MDPKSIWKKSVARAVQSPGNLISGAVSLAASAALWNPLPLILWGLGSTGWVMFASTNQKFVKGILDEEQRAREIRIEKDREVLRQRVDAMLMENPVAGWMRAGYLPDYMAVYRRLVDIRERISKVIHERREIDASAEAGILQQLSYMLTAYLQFVRERVIYLQIIANIRPATGSGGAVPPPPPPERSRKRGYEALPSRPAPPLPNVEQRLAEVDAKVNQLKELAQKEPATAKTRQWHIGILDKQRELLLECQKRDQMVVAQLGAFSDVFEVILGRVSASQFSATEVASYMGSVVEQIVETERFVESLRPAMNELMGGMAPV
ncbi:MAG TPA: hypothetical protein VLT87_17475 [Thermoanaerobaculia bacterium]|nr:hypothetical protein [Thermoanaerobaculia bacterium]